MKEKLSYLVESVWLIMSLQKGSNPQHSEYRTDTLPLSYGGLSKWEGLYSPLPLINYI